MSYKALRTEHEPRVTNLYGFSSAKKMASVLVRTNDGFRLYNKVMLRPAHCHTCRCCLCLPAWPCGQDLMCCRPLTCICCG
jgi:arginyl-tRNA--protein-N-Asp/Glu arginylyltransferase